MLHKTRNLVEDWRKGDAEKLATFEMEADTAWPGGGGWQTTADEQEREIRESNLLGAYVTENERRIVSICTIRAKPGQKVNAFIPYLNCHPEYHGKKHGKSVLQAALDRACEAGFQRVDLYTWSGNLKAVPLYKKMGSCGGRTRPCTWRTSPPPPAGIRSLPVSSPGTIGTIPRCGNSSWKRTR